MIIPTGIVINIVQIRLLARSSNPTAVKDIVKRNIGPIRLILPSGPQEYSMASCSMLLSGRTHALLSESKTGIIIFLFPSAQLISTPMSNSIDLNFLMVL